MPLAMSYNALRPGNMDRMFLLTWQVAILHVCPLLQHAAIVVEQYRCMTS